MRNLKLTLEYDGTHFRGFQRQVRHRTVQAELEKAAARLFQKKVKMIGAGRTDSGVHAEGQVANFHIDTELAPWKIKLGLNRYLPHDVSVVEAEEAPPSFHAQRSAKSKVYQYRVINRRSRSPLERERAYHIPYPLDVSKMRRAARSLVGRHDFRTFETNGSRRKSAVRTVKNLRIERHGSLIAMTIESNGFLYKMVRSIVGTLLLVGSGRIAPAEVGRLITHTNRSLAGPTAPPQGLTLKQTLY